MSEYLKRALVGGITLTIAVFCLSACIIESVSSQCERVVEKQCEACFACADGDDIATGADICGLLEATNEPDCRRELQDQCEQQSRLLRDPYTDLENCESSLDSVTCDQRLDWYALDQDRSPQSCAAFLY